jgi:hypothetical protein
MILCHVVILSEELHCPFRNLNVNVGVPRHDLSKETGQPKDATRVVTSTALATF